MSETMKSIGKAALFILALILLIPFVIVGYINFDVASQPSDLEVVSQLKTKFAVLTKYQIKNYRNQNWCKLFEYPSGTFSNVDNTNCTFYVDPISPKRFDSSSKDDFNSVVAMMDLDDLEIGGVVNVEYGPDGIIGADFHVMNLKTTYVFKENYGEVPKGNGRNLVYVRIDDDWYTENL